MKRAAGVFRPLFQTEGCNSSISVFTADRTAYGGSPETLWETVQRQFSRRSTPFGFFQPSASPVSQCRADPQGHKARRIEQQRKRDRRTGRPPCRLFVQPLRQNDRPLRNWLLSLVYAERGHLCLFFSPAQPAAVCYTSRSLRMRRARPSPTVTETACAVGWLLTVRVSPRWMATSVKGYFTPSMDTPSTRRSSGSRER